MATSIERAVKPDKVLHPVIAANSTVFTAGDPVSKNSSGFLTTATAGSKVLGYCLETKTVTSDNQTVAKYSPQVAPAEGTVLRITADAAVTQAMMAITEYKDLGTVTSGAMTLATADITGGQFKIIGFDPDNDGTTTLALVVAAERDKDAYAQA